MGIISCLYSLHPALCLNAESLGSSRIKTGCEAHALLPILFVAGFFFNIDVLVTILSLKLPVTMLLGAQRPQIVSEKTVKRPCKAVNSLKFVIKLQRARKARGASQ